MYRPLISVLPRFSRLSISSKYIPSSQGDLSILCETPAMGHPVCGFSHSLPRAGIYFYNLPCPLQVPFRGAGFDSIAFLPFLFNCMCIFLNSYLYQESCQFQFIFSEDCSTYRSIPLCVFVGEVELHVFLLHHLFFPLRLHFLEDFLLHLFHPSSYHLGIHGLFFSNVCLITSVSFL